ncbi:hypothetical protein C4H12_02145 [Capnocytophaga sp. oral taxon 878]|nr:hypothetical protein C4H12_02145 [Capnocytophaga sp. oral taxon 878]
MVLADYLLFILQNRANRKTFCLGDEKGFHRVKLIKYRIEFEVFLHNELIISILFFISKEIESHL